MKETIKLKKRFRGLPEGTEFIYNEELDSWVFEKCEEDISDNSIISQRSKVQFSNSFVENNKDVFDIPTEVDDNDKQELINKYTALLEQIQEEINELKALK